MTTAEAKRMEHSTDPNVRETAKRVLAAAKRRKEIHRSRRARSPGPTKEARRVLHREETSDLRADVWVRAGGTKDWDGDEHEGEWVLSGVAHCEVSGVELGAAWDMHHVESGGARRSQQRIGNVLAVSFDVHRLIHRGDLDTLRAVAKCPVLDAEGRRAAERRVEKAESVRVVF